MIRGSYCHRTGYYKVFCIELIPKRWLYSLGGVSPKQSAFREDCLTKAFSVCIHVVSRDLFLRSGQRCPANPRKLSVESDGNSSAGWRHCPRPAPGFDSSDTTLYGPFHILSFSFSRHKQALQRWGFRNTTKDAEGTEKLKLAFLASQFNGSSNADLLKMMWNLER